jgi:hypothetical protein
VIRWQRHGSIEFVGLPMVSPQLERMRPALARRGHQRTFRKKASIYLPGPVKNALLSAIVRAEHSRTETRAYITPHEFLTESLGLGRKGR